jgi:heavy metal efflux system protein
MRIRNFLFSQLIRDKVEEALSGVEGANSIKRFGNDPSVLEEAGERVVNVLQSVGGIENVELSHIVGQPNLEIEINRRACARHGINVADIEDAVQVAIGGKSFARIGRGGDALRHRPPPADGPPRRPDRLSRFPIDTPEASGDRRGRRDARHAAPAPLPDAGAFPFFSRPSRPGRAASPVVGRLVLHRRNPPWPGFRA